MQVPCPSKTPAQQRDEDDDAIDRASQCQAARDKEIGVCCRSSESLPAESAGRKQVAKFERAGVLSIA